MKIPNLSQAILQLKKPKILTLGILLLTIAIAVLALNLLAKRNRENPFLPPATSLDPELQSVAEKISRYNAKLDNFKDFRKELIYPIVDLDIKFD